LNNSFFFHPFSQLSQLSAFLASRSHPPIDPPLGGAGTAGTAEAAEAAENFFNEVNFNIIEWPAFHQFDDKDDRDLAIMPRDETPSPPPPYSERASMPPPLYAAAASQRPPEVIELSDKATEQPPEHYFPNPPPSALYNSFNELFVFLQTFHRKNGLALRTERSSNPQVINRERVLTYRALICDRASSQASSSTGIQRSSTQRMGYPYKITASATRRAN
jgi:hypothetical protein